MKLVKKLLPFLMILSCVSITLAQTNHNVPFLVPRLGYSVELSPRLDGIWPGGKYWNIKLWDIKDRNSGVEREHWDKIAWVIVLSHEDSTGKTGRRCSIHTTSKEEEHTMIPRERIIAALRGELVDRVPLCSYPGLLPGASRSGFCVMRAWVSSIASGCSPRRAGM